MGPKVSADHSSTERNRSRAGEFAFELVIVFIGVTAAFGLENFREARQEASYRQAMLGGLRASFGDFATHGVEIDRRITSLLRVFDNAARQAKMPALPVYREAGGEHPPTRAWDGIVASGAARSLDPTLYFDLARFYDRAQSFGSRYDRYNRFTEERVLPYLQDESAFYEKEGRLKPEYAAYVERLRDLQRENHALVLEAAKLEKSLPH